MLKITVLEPDRRFIPFRAQYFTQAFWEEWEKLSGAEKEVYLLGWLAKLDHMLQRLDRKLSVREEGGSGETDQD